MTTTEQLTYKKLVAPIQEKHLITFTYKDAKAGKEEFKMVEPFQVGYHKTTGNAILSAWCIPQNDKEKAGWRIYRLSAMSNVTALRLTFTGDRPEYNANSNQTMKEILISIEV
jgi:predicted DNA-binding transcriptional regulator YafY